MTDHTGDGPEEWEEEQPLHGQIRHSHLSALLPTEIGQGVFSNGVMILTGPFELALDFVLRMGERQRIVRRVVLPLVVAQQFARALEENMQNYERRFGPIPRIPKPLPDPTPPPESPLTPVEESQAMPASTGDVPNENLQEPQESAASIQPQIEDIYDELKIPDEMLSGRYANAVLIRHSGTEFCFDFITNLYPRSAVSSRVFLATPHAPPLLSSLKRSLTPPGSSQDFA